MKFGICDLDFSMEGEASGPQSGSLFQRDEESASTHHKQAMLDSPHLSIESLLDKPVEGCWLRILMISNISGDEKEKGGG